MANRSIVPSSYRKLVAEIVRIYDEARRSLIEAHWEIGKRVVEIEQDGAARAAYGSGLLARLSEDLTRERGAGFSGTNLKRFRRFYLSQKRPPVAQLGWSHQNELMLVKDAGRRKALAARAAKEGLTRNELRALIRSKQEKPKTKPFDPADLLVPKKGPLDLYRIRRGADVGWPRPEALLFDHGFRFYDEMSAEEARGLAVGDIVEDRGDKLVKVKGALKPGYTYTAFLQRVIDGDTFWVALAAGWGGIAHQKLRLRNIDCPELDTPEGKAAKKFVELQLTGAGPLTVYSSKNDNHDRYEADVFFKGEAGTEVFLNNLLMEKGHAVRMDC
jgi:endonuclease YncB( thermonuclease family)